MKYEINDLIRMNKYSIGDYCLKHCDTVVTRYQFTFLLFLNTTEEGGELKFIDKNVLIKPIEGRAVLFKPQLIHESLPVKKGNKIVLRTDILNISPNNFEEIFDSDDEMD